MHKISHDEAVRLFDTPTQDGLYFKACDYCGEIVSEGTRYHNSSKVFHEDCFQVKHSMLLPKFNPFTEKLDVNSSTQTINVAKEVLNKLLDDSFDNFPSQRTYLLIGDDNIITDLVKSPLFNYELLQDGEFSRWALNEPEQVLEESLNLFKNNKVIGFAHAHDNNGMSLSDLVYPSIHYYVLICPLINCLDLSDKAISDFNLQLQFNSFFPIMDELVLLNHVYYKGRKPLILSGPRERTPSKQFINYYENNHPFLVQAKKIARQKIECSITDYLSVYSLDLVEFTKHPVEFCGELVADLAFSLARPLLKSKDINKIKLVDFFSGKIKEHKIVIS